MKVTEIFWINTKKLTKRTKKALFLIIPIGILMSLSIVVSSQISNIQSAVDESIFGTIDEQNTLIQLEVEQEEIMGGMRMMSGDFELNKFSTTDVTVLEEIDHVESVNLLSEVPISNITTSSLFEDIEVSMVAVVGLDSTTANLYTNEQFEYVEGEAIPIILNANSFIESYEDWGGETEISLGFGMGGDREERMNLSPFKTRAIDYEKEDLIGNEITISFGGLDDLPTSETSMGNDGPVITKLTEEEIAESEEEREEAISEYWDYDRISKTLDYEFVVVGVIEDASDRAIYIPSDFADVLMSDYISNQLNALFKDVPQDLLNADFTGMTYDGYEVSIEGVGMINQMAKRLGGVSIGGMSFGGDLEELNSYTIPGLVIEIDENDNVIGIFEDTNVYTNAEKYSTKISVKIDNVSNRDFVVKDINDAGYALQDLSDTEVFSELQNTLSSISTGLVIAFIVLVAGVVVLTMSKLVSESTKEIGIFRAIGVKKNSISNMFIIQSIMYIGIGYALGVLLGVLLNLGVSGVISNWFSTFIASTVSESFSVVQTVDSSIFLNINWSSIAFYSVLLLVISLLVSFFPARSAASVSPVEAINNE